ncbi:ABC transporter substrate-binding protein [Streptomyces sp. KM273126]|uniref:ABC transporter substrate-binding protein n=1 Tax=Streptomyces sp. KM273126 TaxID=2545247 RepID=UPI001404F7DC|nr:ABC transporter substrate-binding protein [Streptomyces sp. KM273126]MBA2808027.1 ABC transporter substrate-binding protein [Streptomyces sp. KM273126]
MTSTRERRAFRVLAAIGVVTALAVGVTACSDSQETSAGSTQLEPSLAKSAKGDVTVCGPTDASGVWKATMAAFNKAHPKMSARYVELGASADDQLQQITQRMQTKSTQCDVLRLDVVWTAQLAAQGGLADMSKVIEPKLDELIPSTASTLRYEDKYWGVPFYSNAGLLYYRTDKVRAPGTWQELYSYGEKNSAKGFLYQASQSESLTVSFLELLYSAGGEVLDKDGKVAIDSPKTVDVLKFMQNGIDKGASPKSVLTYDEDATRLAFESGAGATMRNYPYAYAAGQKSGIAGKFAVMPLPGWNKPGAGVGVLGGSNVGVSAFSKNKAGAIAMIDFMTSEKWQEQIAINNALAPATNAAYESAEVQKAMPFSQELLQALKSAKTRPVSPVYPQISQAIYEAVGKVLSGALSPEDAASKMAKETDAAMRTF